MLGQTIVDVAYELFVELGFHATTLDKIAQRAKVSKLSIYRHFEDKEALFRAAIASRCHKFAPRVLFAGADGSAEDQLMAVGLSLPPPPLSPGGRRGGGENIARHTGQKTLNEMRFKTAPGPTLA